MFQRNLKLGDFHVHSVCFLQNFSFRSEQKFPSVLYRCHIIFQKFSPSTFRDIFDQILNFLKILRVQDCYLCMHEPRGLARACVTYSILSLNVVCISHESVAVFSRTGHMRQKTISSHLNYFGWKMY